MNESMNNMLLLNSLEQACAEDAKAVAYRTDTPPGRPLLLELALLAFLEAGPSGLRQEQAYPPEGRLLSTGDIFITGNLRNQVCELRKREINIIGWIDPYHLKDGRVMYYKRYAYSGVRSAVRAFRMINQFRRERGAPRIPFSDLIPFFLRFSLERE